ncbi:MAG: ABC transporter substrate-binding protein [Christensenellales bacterium]
MKKLLSLALVLAMLLSLGGVALAQSELKADITWWAFPTFGQENATDPAGTYEQKLAAAFMAKHPGITVKVETIDFTSGPEKLVSAIEGGKAPDVLFDAPGRIVEYGRNGKLVKLDDMFTDAFKQDVNNDALLGACSDGTSYWMYPISSSPFFMNINKDMFEAAGALQYVNQEGDRTWTTENFVKALEALNKAGFLGASVYCGGQGGDQGTRALVSNLYGASIANPEKTQYTMQSEAGAKALTLIKELADKGQLEKGTDIAAADEIKLFVQKVLSMSICWGTSAAKNNPLDFTPFFLPFPSESGTPTLEYLVNGFCVFDNGDENRAAAAKLFIDFLCNDAEYGPMNVKATGAFPVRSSFGNLYEGNADYELLASWTKYYGPYYNTMPGFANMRKQWWGMLQNILTDKSTVEVALADYTAEANKGL